MNQNILPIFAEKLLKYSFSKGVNSFMLSIVVVVVTV